jgi:hypothetical protein
VRQIASNIDHPEYYNQVAGIECIDVVEHFGFNLGNAIKYIWRAEFKGYKTDDLEKALWYIRRELSSELTKQNS